MKTCIVMSFVVFVGMLLVQPATAGEKKKPDEVKKAVKEPIEVGLARAHISLYLRQKGDIEPPPAEWLVDGAIRSSFPVHMFFVVRYPHDPAFGPPEGVAPITLFAIHWDKKKPILQTFDTTTQLMPFFKREYRSQSGLVVKEEAENAIYAWLRFSQELQPGGPYRFIQSIDHREFESLSVAPQVGSITGRSVVSTGGQGQILVTIDFNARARIEHLLEKSNVRGKRR